MTHFFPTCVGRTRLAIVAVGLVATALGGCDHMFNDRADEMHAGPIIIDPSQRHPILVSQTPHKMSLKVARGARGLTPAQRASAIDFFNRFRAVDAGNSKLVIAVPSGSPNEVASMNAVADLRPILADAGFSESSVSIEPYYAEGDPQPPLRISYVRFSAEAPECGKWPSNLAVTDRNLNYEDFGCAQQKNLAAMIANPADLLNPRTMTPANADRRDAQYGHYTKGEPSGASRSGDEKAVNN